MREYPSQWFRVRAAGPGRIFLRSAPLLLVYLFAPFYLIQFAALFMFLLLLGSGLYSEYLLRNLRLIRRDTELRSFRREWTRVELVVENRGRLPAFMLAVTDSPGMFAVFRNNKRLCTLKGRSRLALAWQVYCSDRGIFSLGPAGLRCGDPLGLFPFYAASGEHTRLVVYPAPGIIGIRSPGGIPLGALISPNPLYEDLTRWRSLREYQEGDEPRRINWKASARNSAGPAAPLAGLLLVNEYEAAISCPLVVFLNLDPAEYALRRRELYFERAIEAAAALCLMASRERQELGIILYTPYQGEGFSLVKSGAFTLIPILERLAALERPRISTGPAERDYGTPLGGSARLLLDRGKQLPFGTRLVYCGPDLSGEDYIALNSLKRYRLSLEYLVIDEKRLARTVPGNSPRYQMKEGGYDII
ncbi:MAG: DUF58 domain-containing protein [Treponema sp.]|jgi:uncharacterized protein (DUF58 family)|nr:DUF58 domain-containing protein [Treponema sp.]